MASLFCYDVMILFLSYGSFHESSKIVLLVAHPSMGARYNKHVYIYILLLSKCLNFLKF